MYRLKNLDWAIITVIMIVILTMSVHGIFSPAGSSSVVSTDEFMWYYLPHAPNEQPRPMEKAAYIENYDVLYVGSAEEKNIYLTFDDCPENENIPAILDVLEKHNAPAAFFMTEAFIRQHPDIIKRIVDDGSLVGNHTAHHIGVTWLSFEKFQEELQGVEDAYFEATGKELPRYFRPPQGKFSELTLNYAEKLGYKTVFWSFRYVDWEVYNQPSVEKAYKTIMEETHPGEIALFHCQSKTNVKILDSILTEWERQGYRFRPLNELN